MVDNVPCFQFYLVGLSHDGKLELAWSAHPRACHIQLPMPEHLSPQPNPHIFQRLALRLIYGDSEFRPDRELPVLPLKWVLSSLGNEGDTGKKHHSVGAHYLTFQQLVVDCTLERQSSAITESLSGVDVPKQHQRHSRLDI